jgi:predicted DNA binding CopG/RHH family protein
MRKARKKSIPDFVHEDRERDFWATHDSTDYVDWSQAEKVEMPRLRPSLRSISLRLPESLLERIKVLANKRDVPYQSLIKMFLSERVEHEAMPRKARNSKSRAAERA